MGNYETDIVIVNLGNDSGLYDLCKDYFAWDALYQTLNECNILEIDGISIDDRRLDLEELDDYLLSDYLDRNYVECFNCGALLDSENGRLDVEYSIFGLVHQDFYCADCLEEKDD